MHSTPQITAVLVALCLAVVYLSLRIGFWLGAVAASRIRAANPQSELLHLASGATSGGVVVALVVLSLTLGSLAPAGSFYSDTFGHFGWPVIVFAFSVAAAANLLSRALRRSASRQDRISGNSQ
jgi:branched-subunit amino acid permease